MRGGIFYCLCLMLLLEGIRFGLSRYPRPALPGGLQPNEGLQAWIDSLKQAEHASPRGRVYDPNRLDDFSGYRLGLSPRALEALYAYRDSGHTLYTLQKMQQVAGLPDSAMLRMLPSLRFPTRGPAGRHQKSLPGPPRDLNQASAEELMAINGVGPVLSARIVKFREALGGFRHPSQLLDVYGLAPGVAQRIMAAFAVADQPGAPRVNLNTAPAAELAALVYLTPQMARALVARRQVEGPYQSLEQIGEVLDLPKDKIERIALYLTL